MTDNLFKKTGASKLDAVEGIDTPRSPRSTWRTCGSHVQRQHLSRHRKRTENPVTVRHVQGTASSTWNVDLTDVSPFGSEVRAGVSFLADGPLRSASNVIVYLTPYALPRQGAGGRTLQMKWQQDVRGAAQITARFDV